jgi:DinB superfamily
MNAREAIKLSYGTPDHICRGYLADLKDSDLLVRPVPGANHIAWQLGHLIATEHDTIETIAPGSGPPLPAGFKEKHSKQTAAIDDPKAFYTKDEYLKLYDQVRAGTFKALDSMTETDFDKPGPEKMRAFCPTVGSVFALHPNHWLMHAGQWAVVRRKLGKPPLF